MAGTGALIISAMLDFMTFALCAPYSETTEGGNFDVFLEMIAEQGRALFKLFQVSAYINSNHRLVRVDAVSDEVCFRVSLVVHD